MSTKAQAGLIPIQNFNQGGLADSKFSGIKDSLYKMIGFDPHSKPGILRTAQKLTAETTGTEPDEFCKVAINSSNGSQYWCSSTSGKIWERPTTGTWRLVHTLTPAAGAAIVLGGAEYQGYIYLFTQSRIHRITVALADDNNWAVDCVEDWATFGVTNASFHPHVEQNLVLYIGDGNQLAQIDAGTFSANALDIKTPLVIKSLGKIGTDVLLGTYVADNVTKTEIIRWNTWSISFTNSDPIDEVGINAFLQGDNMVFVHAGVSGNIYTYNGETLTLYKKIPGDYSPTATSTVHPDSVANMGNEILFGVSNVTGNPSDQGVYRIGRHSRNYPYIMDLPYPISQRSAGALVLTGIEIGAILAVGSILYVAWKNDTVYGVDKLDYSNKLDGAYLESRVMSVEREKFTMFQRFLVAYSSLPDSTAITIQYDKNYENDYKDTTEVTDTQRSIIYAEDGVEASVLQLRLSITASGNSAPEIESAACFVT